MPANRDSCQNEELPFLRIETMIDNVLQFRQLLKRHPIRFRYMCKCISVLVPATLILPIRVSYFFYFYGEKSAASVVKAPAIAGRRLLF